MKKGKKRLIIFLVIVVLAVVIFLFYKGRQVPGTVTFDDPAAMNMPIDNIFLTERAEQKDYEDSIEVVGTVEADTRIIKSFVSGKVLDVFVKEGDRIEIGQKLARIDDTQYRIRHIEAMNEYEKSMDAGERIQELKKLYLDEAKKDLDNTTIYSPVRGMVSEVKITPGDMGKDEIFTVLDTDSMMVKAEVDEIDYKKLKLGMKVRINFDKLGKMFEGTIDYISPTAISSGGIVLIPIKVSIKGNPASEGIIPGLTCSLNLISTVFNNSIVVSSGTIETDPKTGDNYVTKSTAVGEERVKVTLGESYGNKVQILDGVEDGDILILKPDEKAKNDLVNMPSMSW